MVSTKKRFSAVLLGAALSVSLFSATGATALAASIPDIEQYGNISPNAVGSLTIHKKVTGTGTQGTIYGNDAAATSGETLLGAKFKLFKLNLDLKTSAGWQKLASIGKPTIADAVACNNLNVGSTISAAPDVTVSEVLQEVDVTTGTGKVNNLKVGAYVVCESEVPGNALRAAEPFVVTIPTHAVKDTESGWVYHVNVYPKNVKSEGLTKTIATDGKKLSTSAESHTFTLETKIPTLATNDNFKFFQFADSLANNFASVEPTAVSVYLDGQKLGITDVTVAVEASGSFINVNFTKAGLAKLKTQGGKNIKVEFKATLKSPNANDTVSNKGYFAFDVVTGEIPNTPDKPMTPPLTPGEEPGGNVPGKKIPSNEVKASWGELKLTKQTSTAGNKPLKNAKFEVYTTDFEADACKNDNLDALAAKAIPDNKVETGELKTDDMGVLKVSGLKVSAVNDVASFNEDASVCYIVKETEAPAGYILPEKPYTAILVKKGKVEDTSAGTIIKNTPSDLPDLPLTGANGQILMLIGGASLVLFALGGLMVARRLSTKA